MEELKKRCPFEQGWCLGPENCAAAISVIRTNVSPLGTPTQVQGWQCPFPALGDLISTLINQTSLLIKLEQQKQAKSLNTIINTGRN